MKKYMPKEVSKEVSKEIHARAAPLIKWLKEAEEETSEDDGTDSDEEDVEVLSSIQFSIKNQWGLTTVIHVIS